MGSSGDVFIIKLEGTPSRAGIFEFELCASGSSAGGDCKVFQIKINPAPATLVSIAVTPANPSILVAGTQQFKATGTFSDNSTQDLTTSVTWATGPANSSVASISNTAPNRGLATGNSSGTVTITATSGAISGSTTLTVSPAPVTLTSIAVTPANPSILVGGTQQFTATGTFSDTSTQNLTASVTWTATDLSGTNIAAISNAGLAVGVSPGTATIAATDSATSINGTTILNVSPPPPPTPAGVLERISVDSNGVGSTSGQSPSVGAEGKVISMSADGRYVVFQSTASILDSGDTNGLDDVFLRDTCRGPSAPANCAKTTQRILGLGAPEVPNASVGISGDGQWIAFTADSSGPSAALLVRRTTGGTPPVLLVSSPFKRFHSPVLSRDGRYVAFVSDAALLPADPLSNDDVFLLDRDADGNGSFDDPGAGAQIIQVSLTPAGMAPRFFSNSPAISADGRFVVFLSGADDLIPNDTNDSSDIFLYDRLNATVTRVSVNSAGQQASNSVLPFVFNRNPAISGDGRFIAFVSSADNLIPPVQDTNGAEDVFLRDTCLGAPVSENCNPSTIRVSISNTDAQAVSPDPTNPSFGNSAFPALSFTGRFIAFASAAQNLVATDPNLNSDTFVRDTCLGLPAGSGCLTRTVIVSVPLVGGPPNGGGSTFTEISEDGSLVLFSSTARNLVPGDSSTNSDLFLAGSGLTEAVPAPPPQTASMVSVVTADRSRGNARFVVFQSRATNLLPGIITGIGHIYRAGTTD